MVEAVTRNPDTENLQKASGNFNPDAYANQARGLNAPSLLQSNSIRDPNVVTQGAPPVELSQQHYVIPPTMTDYSVPQNHYEAGPLQHAQVPYMDNTWQTIAGGLAGLASDFSQQQAQATVAATAQNKQLGYQLELQHEAEARDFLETGLDSNGKPISAAELSRRQLQEKVSAGVSPEFVHLTSTGSQALISRKEETDLTTQRQQAAKLEVDTTAVIVHTQQLNFLTLAPKRTNTQGEVDTEAEMQQIHDIAQKYPKAQQSAIYANLDRKSVV